MSVADKQLSNEELLAQLSDEEDLNEENFQFAIIGDGSCAEKRDDVLDFLHQKDLLSKVDITNVYNKSSTTVLLGVDENISDKALTEINKALATQKEFAQFELVSSMLPFECE